MNTSSKIYVAGHNGMVGSALVRKLQQEGYSNIITRTSKELDLCNQQSVDNFFLTEKPEYVFLAAAKVGGILANNTYRANFIYDNLMMEANIINASYNNAVKKLLFLGSSCIYPKLASQPLKEEYLLSGFLEYSNQPYAIAKIAGIELCESYRSQYDCNFISVMPTNLYGTNDNYHPENSHALPAVLRKIILAQRNQESEVVIWGTGTPKREFLHVDDLADACYFLMKDYNEKGIINVGCGIDISINALAILIAKKIGYEGKFVFDESKPDGTPRKLMDVQKITALGWQSKIRLEDGIERTIKEINQAKLF